MNWLDIAILLVLAISTFLGIRGGVIKIVLSLVGLIVGVILAGRYYVVFAERLAFIPQASVAKVVAFVIILVGVMVIASVLASLLKWATSAIMLSWVNRLGGAIFGLVLGAIFCGALLAIWVKFLGMTGAINQSYLAPVLTSYFPIVLALLPEEFDVVRSFFR